jgi:dTDP-4-dehydrorhamnose reductase
LLGADITRVRAVDSEAYPRAASRPRYSVLGHDRHRAAGIPPIADWRVALRRAFPALIAAQAAKRAG